MFVPAGSGQITYTRLREALDSGDLEFIRRNAAQLPKINLADALEICLLLREDPRQLDRASVRWVSRFCLECPDATLADVRGAAHALHAMPEDADTAMEALAEICLRHKQLPPLPTWEVGVDGT